MSSKIKYFYSYIIEWRKRAKIDNQDEVRQYDYGIGL